PKLAGLGVILLSLCAACALIFRYFATEGVRYYIEALRFHEARAGTDAFKAAMRSLGKRYKNIIVCRWSKGLAAVFLGVGGVLIALSFYLLVISVLQHKDRGSLSLNPTAQPTAAKRAG